MAKKLEHLKRLADALRVIPPEKVDMGIWASNGGVSVGGRCGFAGCAIGWAIHLGIAPDGFSLVQNGLHLTPSYRDKLSFDAAAKAYGISRMDANYLFSPEEYTNPTAAKVSNRIRKYVRDNS